MYIFGILEMGYYTPSLFRFFYKKSRISRFFVQHPYREGVKKKFFGDLSQMCLPTHPRVFVKFGKTKGEIRVKNCGMIWLFWGGPCLGISHPTHPHSGKLSQKSLFLHPPSLSNLRSCWVGLWDVFTTISSRISMSEELQIVDPKHPFYIDIFFNLLVFYNCGNKTAVDLRKRVGIY